jgi:hypothetical protein
MVSKVIYIFSKIEIKQDGMNVPADLDLHWMHTSKNVYIRVMSKMIGEY